MRNTKSIRILLAQPPGPDRTTLERQLNRVGFLTEVSWPPAAQLYEFADVVFLAFRAASEERVKLRWPAENPPAALVALLDFENPAVVSEAIRLKAHAVVGLPIQNFGVVANIFVALENFKVQQNLSEQVRRYKTKVESDKLVARAKDILRGNYGLTEDEAHKALRTHAMNKRVSIVEIARAITSADDLASSLPNLKQP